MTSSGVRWIFIVRCRRVFPIGSRCRQDLVGKIVVGSIGLNLFANPVAKGVRPRAQDISDSLAAGRPICSSSVRHKNRFPTSSIDQRITFFRLVSDRPETPELVRNMAANRSNQGRRDEQNRHRYKGRRLDLQPLPFGGDQFVNRSPNTPVLSRRILRGPP